VLKDVEKLENSHLDHLSLPYVIPSWEIYLLIIRLLLASDRST
jgi:hypothetical protein